MGGTVEKSVFNEASSGFVAPVLTSFFRNDPLQCAANLIGTQLVWGKCAGIVVETEAHLVENDEACHTFKRPSARRSLRRRKRLFLLKYNQVGDKLAPSKSTFS